MSSFELNEKVNDYFDIIAEIERLQAQAEAIKDVIKFVMVEKELYVKAKERGKRR